MLLRNHYCYVNKATPGRVPLTSGLGAMLSPPPINTVTNFQPHCTLAPYQQPLSEGRNSTANLPPCCHLGREDCVRDLSLQILRPWGKWPASSYAVNRENCGPSFSRPHQNMGNIVPWKTVLRSLLDEATYRSRRRAHTSTDLQWHVLSRL